MLTSQTLTAIRSIFLSQLEVFMVHLCDSRLSAIVCHLLVRVKGSAVSCRARRRWITSKMLYRTDLE